MNIKNIKNKLLRKSESQALVSVSARLGAVAFQPVDHAVREVIPFLFAAFIGLLFVGSAAAERRARGGVLAVAGPGRRGGYWLCRTPGFLKRSWRKFSGSTVARRGKSVRVICIVWICPHTARKRRLRARLAPARILSLRNLTILWMPDFVPDDPDRRAWRLPKIGAWSAWDGSQGAGVIIAVLVRAWMGLI